MAPTIQKRHLVLLAVNILSLAAFGIIFLARQNYEFVIYVNTALDLIANLIGAILAMLYIRLRYFTCGSRR